MACENCKYRKRYPNGYSMFCYDCKKVSKVQRLNQMFGQFAEKQGLRDFIPADYKAVKING